MNIIKRLVYGGLLNLSVGIPSVLAYDNVFVIENTTSNMGILGLFLVFALFLSFLNVGKTFNLFGSLMLIVAGFILIFSVQLIIGLLVLILGIISAWSVD